TELGLADHHVVDPAVEVEARSRERIVVRPRVAGARVARRAPGVAQDDPGHRRRGTTGEDPQLVAVLLGVQISAQHGGEGARARLPDEARDLARLLLADRAVIVGPAQVRAEDLDRPARPVDLRKDAEPFLALV